MSEKITEKYSLFGKKLKKKTILSEDKKYKQFFNYNSDGTIKEIHEYVGKFIKKYVAYKKKISYTIHYKRESKSMNSENVIELFVYNRSGVMILHIKFSDPWGLEKGDISEGFDEEGKLAYKARRVHLFESKQTTITEFKNNSKNEINLLYKTEYSSNDSSTYTHVIQDGYSEKSYDSTGKKISHERKYFEKYPKQEVPIKYYESHYFHPSIWKYLKDLEKHYEHQILPDELNKHST